MSQNGKRLTALASLVGLCALSALTFAANAGATAAPSWRSHPARVQAGQYLKLTLNRPYRATCSLGIGGPEHETHWWTYAAGTGRIQFAVRPPLHTTPGVWSFTAKCVRSGTTSITRATTRVRVIGPGGSAFVVGRFGPMVRVPVGTGTTNPPASPPLGGRGGVPGDDYPWKDVPQDSQLDPWREYVRECTSFAAWALHSRNGFEMPFYANAIDWGTKAAALGYPVNGTPALGAIAWSQKLPWGHVAWVSEVTGGTVTVQEYNEYGNGTFDSRTVAASSFQYIHFKDLTAPAPTPPPVQPPPSSPGTHPETTGGVTHTWTNFTNAGGSQGASISANQTVQIACKVQGFVVADGNPWWYQLASSPWNSGFYASADAFYNNGATSGSLVGTPFVDPSVPDCTAGSPPPPPPTTYAETTGGVTHTWTNYSNAGGTQGPSINAYQTVQIACKLTGFQVADGNTWWYRIASSPWNGTYYASADAFYNNGQTSGSLVGTPFVDNNVPNC